MKRLSLTGALMFVVAACLVVAPIGAASADNQKLESDPNDQPVVNVGANATYEHQYGPIAGQDQVDPQLGDVDPATCRQNQEVTCNVIPVNFVLPASFKAADTYVATIAVAWDPGTNVQSPYAGVGANGDDLDIYLWFNPECPPAPAKCDMGTAVVKASDTNEPEVVKIEVSRHQNFQLVVNHANGTVLKDGYHLTVSTVYQSFTPPSESLEGALGPKDLSGESGAPVTPSATRAAAPAAPAVTGAAAPAASPAAPVGVDLGSPTSDSGLAALSGGGLSDVAAPQIFKQATAVKPPRHVTPLSLVISLILLPLSLVGSGGAWFVRRRPAALRIRA